MRHLCRFFKFTIDSSGRKSLEARDKETGLSGCVRTDESGVHFADGGLAGSAVALQSGVALRLQILAEVIVDVLPRVGRQEARADAGFLRIVIVRRKGAVNLNVTIAASVVYDVAETIVFLLFNPVRVMIAEFFPGTAHGIYKIEG